MRLPLSVKDRFRGGLFRTWGPEKRPEKWLARLPHDVVEDAEPKGKVVLDAGTGKGRFAIAFAKASAEKVIAVDISPLMLRLAREEADRKGVSGRIVFEVGDVEGLKYPDNHFDIACCMATTMHLPYPSKAISELRRVCKVGGLIIADASITERPKQGSYWRSFTEDEFLKLFEGGLEVEHVRRYSAEGVETSTVTIIAKKVINMNESCPLCRAGHVTEWRYSDDKVYVCRCASHPNRWLIVLRHHTAQPAKEELGYMHSVAAKLFPGKMWRGPQSIKDHWHLHES